jgi:hypothetical protein
MQAAATVVVALTVSIIVVVGVTMATRVMGVVAATDNLISGRMRFSRRRRTGSSAAAGALPATAATAAGPAGAATPLGQS